MQDYEAGVIQNGLHADILMENAGRLCAQQILNTYFDGPSDKQVTVFCGPGNNGGDGLVLARCLLEHRIRCVCYILPPSNKQYKDLVMRNIKRAFICNLSMREIDGLKEISEVAPKTYLAVDCLLGLGASKAVTPRPLFQDIVDVINSCKNIVSIDGPTGLDMDDASLYLKNPVEADETYSLGYLKRGLVLPEAKKYTGKLTVLDIFGEIGRHCK